MARRNRSCKNRDVVHVDERLHSPFYDKAWYEWADNDAMCYWERCGPEDVNAWFEATDTYFRETVSTLLAKTEKRANAVYGGAALPTKISDTLNKVRSEISEWNAFADQFEERGFLENWAHPYEGYWDGEVKKIIRFFDEAACRVDSLNDVLEIDLDSAALTEKPPLQSAGPPPDGNSWFQGDDTAAAPGRAAGLGPTGTAVGVVLIGAGLYFGYKVLTE